MNTMARNWQQLPDKRLDELARDPNPGIVDLAKAEQARRQEWREEHAKRTAGWRAEQQARRDAEEVARKAKREAAEQAQREETEAMLKRRFVSAGSSEAEWEREKAAVVAEHRRRQVAAAVTADDRARAANRARYG